LTSHVSGSILSLHVYHHQTLTFRNDVSNTSAPNRVAVLMTVQDKVCLGKQLMRQNS